MEKPTASETAEIVFQRCYENRGKISFLQWNDNRFLFSAVDCLPEEIVFDRACAISFKSNVRGFDAEIPVAGEKTFSSKEEMFSFVSRKDFTMLLEEELRTSGARIQFSGVMKDAIGNDGNEGGRVEVIFFTPVAGLKAVLDRCLCCINSCFFHETSFSISVAANGCFIRICFEEGVSPHSSLLALTGSYSQLFMVEEEVISRQGAAAAKKNIGSILRSDGSVLSFYRYPDGRIVGEKELSSYGGLNGQI